MSILVEYQKEWTKLYKAESKMLKKALGKDCLTIYHIGATACEGMPSKPIIDILVVLRDHADAKALTNCGYIKRRDDVYTTEHDGMQYRVVCVPAKDKETIALHMAYLNYFLGQKQHTEEFAQKKRAIAEQYADDTNGYENAKKALFEELAPIALKHKEKTERQSTGLAIGMCLGCGVGTALGFAFGNVGIGVCLGVSIGMCFGLALGLAGTSKKSDK